MHLSPRSSSLSIWILLYTFLLTSLVQEVLAARLPDIYWNATNPMFRIDNTDHIIDVNRGNVAYEYDQINIHCPLYTKGTREEDVETYIIYNVSKEEYDTCQIANPAGSRTIAVCDKPYLHRYFTITFRPFTPQPGGLEFRPGQDYYFIALSARPNEPNPTKDCQKYYMKVVFKVCCKKPSQTIGSVIRGSSLSSTTVAPSTSSSSSIVSSSAVPSFAIPKLENDTRVSNYPGVISGSEHPRSQLQPSSSAHGKPPATINKTRHNFSIPSMMATSTHRPHRPMPHLPPSNNYPNFPNDRPSIDSRPSLSDLRRQQQQQPSLPKYPPYSSYHHESTTRDSRFNIQKHPFHPDMYTTPPSRSQAPWWKPHPKNNQQGSNGAAGKQEYFPKGSSSAPTVRWTWPLIIVSALTSAIATLHHWRSA